jgi:aminocarboxymuconate-semialdehyde decarboxylase
VGENCRVDFHTHVVVDLPDFAQRLGDPRWPSFVSEGDVGRLTRNGQVVRSVAPSAWLPQRRIDDMEAAGVDRQVLSLIPPLICDFGDPAQAVEWTMHLNGAVAALVAENPNRCSGLGTVPLHHPDRAIQVLQRVHDDGLAGVEIGTSAGVRELDHPDLREFFQAAGQLGMLIFVHPLALGLDAYSAQRIAGPAVAFGLGMGTDTAIAASRLVFGGVVADAPELKICLAHGGGTFFWALARIAFMWDQQADMTAEQLTRNVYVDSVVFRQANLRYLCEQIGSARIVFGTDYPLPAQADMQGTILTGLPDADVARIGGLNASSLLDVCPTCH